jgi:TonB family protein
VVVSKVEATYPPQALVERRGAKVVLTVTVTAEGAPVSIEISQSGGDEFDQAAKDALSQWTFSPALRGQTAVVSRIKIPFTFTPPGLSTQPSAPASQPGSQPVFLPQSGPSSAPSPASQKTPGSEPVIDVIARGQKTPPPRAISDFVLQGELLTAAPVANPEGLLTRAPGVYVSKPESEAVAGEIFLRGFDAEHGQDIALSAGPVPINLPSHIHGQGYADLGLIIPEAVRSIRVTEGVYDPRQGDFAVAGSIHFDLGVEERGYRVSSTFGSFDSFRQLVLWAPEGEPEETFTAVSIRRTAGFGENRGATTGAGLAQYAFDLPGGYHALLHVGAYGSRASFPGIIRLDDVDAGRVDFFGGYDDPSAKAQSAFATRAQAAISVEKASKKGDRSSASLWFVLGDFRLRANYTGYTERSEQNADFSGRGDLIEQRNDSTSFGASFTRRSARITPFDWARGNVELGMSFRTDLIDQVQNLLAQPNNEIWDQRIDASIEGSDLGAYGDLDFALGEKWHFRGGLRADLLYYDINDRLGNFIPQFSVEDHIVGFTRGAIGLAAGPRAALEYAPNDWLSVQAAYGEGYRSPQARILREGETAPYAKVRSAEVGAKAAPLGALLSVSGALFGTFLDNDLAFDASEGGLEFIGPTQRIGGVLQVSSQPRLGLFANLSVTAARATLLEPPPPTAENPVPPFEKGQLLPFVPPVVVRADLSGKREQVFVLADRPVSGRLGLGASYLSSRPLPYKEFAAPFLLVDAGGALRWGAVELGLEALNLLNSRYAASVYSFSSNWNTTDLPSLVPTQHISAGAPFSAQASLRLFF